MIEKFEFLIGMEHERKKLVKADLIWKHFVRYFIFRCKKGRRLPYFPSLKFELEGLFYSNGMYNMLQQMQKINELYS